MLNLRWGESLSWSHDVFSSVNVTLSWIFPAAGQKWYCYAYLCVCHKEKKKNPARLPSCFPPLFPVLTGVFGSDSIWTSWAEITERLQLISIQEAFFFFLKATIKSCWHILKYWLCRGAFPSLQSFNQLCSGCETLMETPPTPAETTRGWEDTIRTDFMHTAKINYWALLLDKNEVRVSNVLLEPGSVRSCAGVASILSFFYYGIQLYK